MTDGPIATDRIWIVPIAARPADRWSLTGRYVEVVWAEFLGPTATLLARRLGDFIEQHPGGGEMSLTIVGVSLGVPPSKVRASLMRLDRFGITSIVEERGAMGVSGLAPPIGPTLLARLSSVGYTEHTRQLEAAAPVVPPPPAGRSGGLGPLRRPASGRVSPGRSL